MVYSYMVFVIWVILRYMNGESVLSKKERIIIEEKRKKALECLGRNKKITSNLVFSTTEPF